MGTTRTAIVTGAGSGMGLATVRRFLDAGYAVVAGDVAGHALEPFADRDDVAIVLGDLTDHAVAEATVDAAIERFGQIDVLVNCAGRPGRASGVDECGDEEWAQNFALHVTAPFIASRRAIPHMREGGGGLIINVSSASGWVGGNNGVAYTSSKHALIGLSKNIAAMYAEDGIRSIAICPGLVETGASEVVRALQATGDVSERSMETRARTRGAMLRKADADEIAQLVLHLAEGGDALLNGATLTADSGFAAHR